MGRDDIVLLTALLFITILIYPCIYINKQKNKARLVYPSLDDERERGQEG